MPARTTDRLQPTVLGGDPSAGCPKHMAYGPCAGVDDHGACEVSGVGTCTFLGAATVPWQPPPPSPPSPRRAADAGPAPAARPLPRIVAHLAAAPLDSDSLRRSGTELGAVVDAVLCGDSPGARVQLPPAYRARLLLDEGLPAMAGLNCRDRNRVALEGEIAALADLQQHGLVGVHCVTGDHPVRGHRPDASPVFDLDATRLAGIASRAGLLVCVAAAPQAPPGVVARAERLVEKVRAGAAFAMLDDVPVVMAAAFAQACAALGAVVPLLAGVPVVTSPDAARAYPGAHLPPGFAERIAGARDPRAAGLAEAYALALRLLDVPGVTGIHLSPGVVPGQELQSMSDVAELARRLA